ncbi:MAG: nitrate- and nitrite sensing domain-containing protein, partial [Thermodesulfobacteriota bacterium]
MRKFINDLKMRSKLILMLLFPVLGLLFFSINGIWEKSSEANSMGEIQELSELAVRISALVHETQKERGATALYLGSKGTKFVSELSQQRTGTDTKISEVQTFASEFDSARFGGDFQRGLDGALNQLEKISGRRESVSAMSISTAEAIGYYTNMNGMFLNVISHMARISSNAEVGTMTAAYVNFLMGKERAGIERAVLSNTFARDNFGAGMFNKFGSLVTAQDTYTNVFLSFADTGQKEFYKNKLQGQAVAEVASMREVAFSRAATGDFGVDPTYWFKMMTGKINLLKEVEDYLSVGLNERAVELRGSAKATLFIYIALTLITVVVASILALFIMRSITRPLNAMAESSKKLAEGDLDVSLDVSSRDEVGVLAVAFGGMVAYMKEMAHTADAIEQGDLSVEVKPKSERDVLGNSFKNMAAYLKETAHTAEAIAEGDLTRAVNPKSEKDVLGNAFKEMLGGLRDIVTQVRTGADQIASASTEIASTSEQSNRNGESAATAVEEVTSTMHEMSANIQNVARSIQTQASSVTETSTSIEELIASIQKVADNARKMVEIAQQSAEAVASGREAVDRSTEGVRDITSVMGESAETIKQLGVRTEDIGKIIEVIDDIAEQTNLLALNAAIEAARAGEHGMG